MTKQATLMTALALCLLVAAGQAAAATTGTISVTVSLQSTVSVDVSPTTWNIGPIALDGTDTLTPVTATNNGNVTIDLNIKGSNGATNWTINGTSTGADQFTVQAHNGTPALSPTSFLLTTVDHALSSSLATSSSQTFDLTFTAPSSDTGGGGADQSFDVTVTASQTP